MKLLLTFALALSLGCLSTACGGAHTEPSEASNDNPSGNNRADDELDEMKGNHANTPAEPPATEYPGSGAPDTVNTKTGTKVNTSQTK